MFDLNLLRSPDFWFAIRWNPLHPKTVILMLAVFAVLILAGILLPLLVAWGRTLPKFERKAWAAVGRPAIAAGVLGALFTFLAYEQVPLFSARFWFLIILVGFLVAEALAIRELMLELPQHRDEVAAREQAARYLPKPKS